MKTQPGPIKFAILAAVAVAAALTLLGVARSTPTPTPTPCDSSDPAVSYEKFVLKIKPYHQLKDGSKPGETAFKALLNNGHYDVTKHNKLHMKHTLSSDGEECLPTGAAMSSNIDIQTDKVTMSEIAKGLEAGELTLIQPHVTIQIACHSPDDVTAVLNLLAP